MNVCCTQAELPCTRLQDDVRAAVEILQLLGYLQCAIGGSVVYDDDFPVQLTAVQRG